MGVRYPWGGQRPLVRWRDAAGRARKAPAVVTAKGPNDSGFFGATGQRPARVLAAAVRA